MKQKSQKRKEQKRTNEKSTEKVVNKADIEKAKSSGHKKTAEKVEKNVVEKPKVKKSSNNFFCVLFALFDLALIGLIIFTVYSYYRALSLANVTFLLNGEKHYMQKTGSKFEDPGFYAIYCFKDNCQDISDSVIVSTKKSEDLKSGKIGIYEINYKLDYANFVKAWDYEESREVEFVDDTPPVLELIGEESIGIYEGEGYSEPGFRAKDDLDGDLTGAVKIEGGVDTGAPGVYKIHYSVEDSSGNRAEKTRLVFVYKGWYTFQLTPTKTFEELEQYIRDNGWDISFGYYNLDSGKTYTFQGDKIYYGASLVKVIDAMYAYEKTDPDAATQSLVRSAITYSQNGAHISLVQKYGLDNLREYAESIGMKYHLKGSNIYDDTYYFCDTTVEDQLTEWEHLWKIINNTPRGEELKWYFINNYWDNLSFSGSPTHMYKNGLYASNYHETGIMFADSPYIVTLLSTEGWRWNSTTIVKDLSHRIYMINQLVAEGEVL